MNERIRELIEECTDRHFSECVGGFETFDKEKFAELIVRECDRYAKGAWEHGPLLGRDLLVHFGIEDEE
jgi:hypothetical protein